MVCLIRALGTGEIMSSRQKLLLNLKNFRDLLKKILRNKKALVGVILLLFFAFLAIFGPLFVTDDPINQGSVPIGRMPLAIRSAVPGWYRDFTGSPQYTTNIYPALDAKFSDPNGLKKWANATSGEGVTVVYDSQSGPDANSKGCVQANFNSTAGNEVIPASSPENATYTLPFDYLFSVPPSQFGTELFYNMTVGQQGPDELAVLTKAYHSKIGDPNYNTDADKNGDGRVDLKDLVILSKSYPNRILITAYFLRTLAQGQKAYPATDNISLAVSNSSGWNIIPWYKISSLEVFKQYGTEPSGVIFSSPGAYAFELCVSFSGNVTNAGNPKVQLSNVNLCIFGNSFGVLGSDDQARDIFSQLIAGTRISFILGIVTAVVSVGLGLLVGLVAGYIGGATDEILMRVTDMLLVIPSLPLIIVLVFVIGQNLLNLIIVIGFLGWMGFARTVRSAILSLKERSFIEAVRSSGGGRFYIIRKHLVPNVFPLIYITLAMSVPGAIVTEAALSFLGLGPQDVMSWGRILYEYEASGQIATGAFTTWYWTIPPGVFIALLSLSFILIGFSLDEILNPRLRER